MDNAKDNAIKKIAKSSIKESQKVRTDGFRRYNIAKKEGYEYQREVVKGENAN